MNYSLLLSASVLGLLSQALPAAAQTTRPTPATTQQPAATQQSATMQPPATTQPVAAGATPVQLACRSFSGHVKSSNDGTPLVGATVLVKGTYVARTTNDEGYFTFDLPAAPTQAPRLMVSSAGFAPQDFLITTCSPLDIELQILEGTRIKQRGKHKGFIKQAGKE